MYIICPVKRKEEKKNKGIEVRDEALAVLGHNSPFPFTKFETILGFKLIKMEIK
jgi:hypothetical protein